MNDVRKEVEELMRQMFAARTKEDARAVVEAEAQSYLAHTPGISIEGRRNRALEHIGYISGSMHDRVEANRLLDLFETEHPWKDREGNHLPQRRTYGQSRRARPATIVKNLIYACRTKEEASALVAEEAANMAADDSPTDLGAEFYRKLFLDSVRWDVRHEYNQAIAAKLTELFDLKEDVCGKIA